MPSKSKIISSIFIIWISLYSFSNIDIIVDVGVKEGKANVWTCDLSHGYVEINADYRS